MPRNNSSRVDLRPQAASQKHRRDCRNEFLIGMRSKPLCGSFTPGPFFIDIQTHTPTMATKQDVPICFASANLSSQQAAITLAT
jgi:hypothetical protein